jgi:hypothetical protein
VSQTPRESRPSQLPTYLARRIDLGRVPFRLVLQVDLVLFVLRVGFFQGQFGLRRTNGESTGSFAPSVFNGERAGTHPVRVGTDLITVASDQRRIQGQK